jgi:hypothetical protein
MSDQHKELLEFVELVVEKKVREADVTGGKKVRYGSKKHVKDLEGRIRELDSWRQKHKKGSEHRANYSRVINRLKNELQAAKRANLKENAEERGPEWVASERERLLKTWSREALISWLRRNDPNGIWTDEDMIANDMDPMTLEDAVEQVMQFVEEYRETPEETAASATNFYR